jgi:hypothetical protein
MTNITNILLTAFIKGIKCIKTLFSNIIKSFTLISIPLLSYFYSVILRILAYIIKTFLSNKIIENITKKIAILLKRMRYDVLSVVFLLIFVSVWLCLNTWGLIPSSHDLFICMKVWYLYWKYMFVLANRGFIIRRRLVLCSKVFT